MRTLVISKLSVNGRDERAAFVQTGALCDTVAPTDLLIHGQVHPDLFEQQPLARMTNEASMMKLNQWLDEREQQDTARLAFATPPLQVSFFVREHTTSALRKVDHVLVCMLGTRVV